jgi:hypothetical protein
MRTLWSSLPLCVAAVMFAGCENGGRIPLRPNEPALARLAWLTGAWAGRNDDGSRTEEHWTQPTAGMMLGVNRTIAGGETIFFEYLRIEAGTNDAVTYYAAPRGRDPATPFLMVESEPDRFVFENLQHDFPQRIIYEVAWDGALVQRIEGIETSGEERSSEWRLERAEVVPDLSIAEYRSKMRQREWRYEQIREDSAIYGDLPVGR